jgi:rhomboid protease GluP
VNAAAPPFKPRVTPFIIGLNVAVYIAMVVRGVSMVQPRSEQLLEYGANFGALVVAEAEWWRPLTSMFVHIGAVHLLFNMYALWNVGSFIERLLGRPMFLVVYLLT